MRLWHKDLIPVLPNFMLVSQWRECCCIAKLLANNKTPNHRLVNPILQYPSDHFYEYTQMVIHEMQNRNYNVSIKAIQKFNENFYKWSGSYFFTTKKQIIFKDWHNNRYLKQCFYNLQEKYDRGIIAEDEWNKINSLLLL